MIYWRGKRYKLTPSQYNGRVFGYLFDGVLVSEKPRRAVIRGHIVTDDGVIIVLGRNLRCVLYALLVMSVASVVVLWPRYEYVDYQVTFAERPLFSEEVLYCNVVNEAEIPVTVQFLNENSKSIQYSLEPGEALPYIYIDFVPEVIRYNGKSDFPLEVRSD